MAFDSSAIRPAIGDLPEINDLEDRVAFVEENITPAIQAVLDGKVESSTVDFIQVLTQAAYDDIDSPDERTLYVVVG